MKIIPYHSIPKQPKELRKKLEILVSQIRSQLAVAGIRQSARESGKAQMTDAEIDSVIQEVRTKRRS